MLCLPFCPENSPSPSIILQKAIHSENGAIFCIGLPTHKYIHFFQPLSRMVVMWQEENLSLHVAILNRHLFPTLWFFWGSLYWRPLSYSVSPSSRSPKNSTVLTKWLEWIYPDWNHLDILEYFTCLLLNKASESLDTMETDLYKYFYMKCALPKLSTTEWISSNWNLFK